MHRHRKQFGQNFLSDDGILMQMQQVIRPAVSDHMIEIGPGLGALTKHLIDHVETFEAIEIDRDLIGKLQDMFGDRSHFTLHEQDVLTVDWYALAKKQPLRIVGNLPYNISTPLLFKLYAVQSLVQDMHFLLQKEVGERLAAAPGTSKYGRLSVMTQYYGDVELLIPVPPEAFIPAPKVDSLFLRITPKKPTVIAKDVQLLEKVVAQAFNQRRKTLRNSLSKLADADLLTTIGVDPQKRAQELTVDEYVRISNQLIVD